MSALTQLRWTAATQMSLSSTPFAVAITSLIIFLLCLTGLRNPVLSHSVAEIFSVVVALGIFMLTWNARRLIDNHYFLFVGIACLFVGAFDQLHALSHYGLLWSGGPNLEGQLWLAARYLQGVALLMAPLFAVHSLRTGYAFGALALASVCLFAPMYNEALPDWFAYGPEGDALSNSLLAIVDFGALGTLFRARARFDRDVFNRLVLSILFCAAAALAGVLYKGSTSGLIVHSLTVASFYLLYKAIIATGLLRPYDVLFRNLKQSEQDLRTARDTLEVQVSERTADLRKAHARAEEALAEAKRVEDERQLAIDALRESEERFRTVVERSPEAKMIVWQGRIIFKNPEQERLFGPQPEEILLRDAGALHTEDESTFEQFCAAIGEESSRRQTLELRFYLTTPAGEKTLRWMHCQSNPIDYQGKKATLVSMVDITRVKELERIVALRENLASMGQLATGIAHEIRNPLSGVNLNLSTIEGLCLRSDGLGAQEKETLSLLLGQAKAASSKIASVVQHVMDFSRHAPPKLEMVDVNRVVEAAAEFSLATLRRSEIELHLTLEPNEVKCLADFRLLEHVLLNLITNAVEAMQCAPGRKRLGLATARRDDRAVITVSDSGPGVPAHLRDTVFEPFYTTRKEGHGIGLSFSHRIITDHGGSLTVSTSQWDGAEFRIELPSERSAKPA